jgi:hypothetical protein
MPGMVTKWVAAAVLLAGGLMAACGSAQNNPSDPGKAGSSAESAGTTSGGAGGFGGGGGAHTGGTASGGGASGGGPALDATCQERSTNHLAGTRLRYHVLKTAEGDLAWNGFYDAKTGKDCALVPGSDKKTRCYPLDSSSALELYTDAGCTDAVYQPLATCPYNYLSVTSAVDACSAVTTFYTLGAQYPVTSALYSKDATGNCAVAAVTPETVFRKGAALSPDDYVEVEPTQFPSAGRIASTGYSSADGARIVRGFRDTELDADCSFVFMRDGKQHCVARGLQVDGYSDASCSMSLLVQSTTCGVTPAPYAIKYSSEACLPGAIALKAGPEFTGTFHQNDAQSQTCIEQSGMDPTTKVFEPVELPDSSAPALETTINQADPGRLQSMYFTNSDGSCVFSGFWDTELQAECQFYPTPGGGFRCFPDGLGAGTDPSLSTFADAGCSQPADYYVMTTCLAAKVPKLMVKRDRASCGAGDTWHVRPIGAAADPATLKLWTGVPGSCSPVVLTDNSYFKLGAELPLTGFVSAELVPE